MADYNEKFAEIYDVYFSDFAMEVASDIVSWLQQHRLDAGHSASGRVLEVACGTGHLSVAIARAGYAVTALDSSRPMLDLASAKLGALSGEHTAIQGEFLSSSLPSGSFEFVTCTNASLNQMRASSDLDAIAEALAAPLAYGGSLVADIYSLESMMEWGNVMILEAPDRLWVMRGVPRCSDNHLWALRLSGVAHIDDCWVRFDQTIDSRYIAPADLVEALARYGVVAEAMTVDTPCASSAMLESGHTFVVGSKIGEAG